MFSKEKLDVHAQILPHLRVHRIIKDSFPMIKKTYCQMKIIALDRTRNASYRYFIKIGNE
jgi:hypothetical protein